MLLMIIVSGCGAASQEEPQPPPQQQPIPEEPLEDEIVELTISSVGDIMAHMLQLQAAYNEADDTYDFTNNYGYIKPYIEQADLAIANLETTFAGESRAYSGYPTFNAPDALADALKFAGFKVISTVNNHTIDTGLTGMLRTLDVLQDRDLTPVGTRKSTEEDSYVVKDIDGIKIGITAYSYESPSTGGRRMLNGIPIPQEAENLIDTFDYDKINEDLDKMANRINEMKEQGAEIIVFVLHWGNEYRRSTNVHQENIAQNLSDLGVDVIFGSHPHVIQPVQYVNSQISGKKTLVAYSLGNFISNQRLETLDNRYTEDGLLVNVTFEKNMTTGHITMKEVSYVPTWVNRYVVSGQWTYEIIPVYQALANPEQFNLVTEETIKRAQMSLDDTVNWIEQHNSEIIIDKEVR